MDSTSSATELAASENSLMTPFLIVTVVSAAGAASAFIRPVEERERARYASNHERSAIGRTDACG